MEPFDVFAWTFTFGVLGAKVMPSMAKIIYIYMYIFMQHFASLSSTVLAINSKLSFHLQSGAMPFLVSCHCWPALNVDHTYNFLCYIFCSFLPVFQSPFLTCSFHQYHSFIHNFHLYFRHSCCLSLPIPYNFYHALYISIS